MCRADAALIQAVPCGLRSPAGGGPLQLAAGLFIFLAQQWFHFGKSAAVTPVPGVAFVTGAVSRCEIPITGLTRIGLRLVIGPPEVILRRRSELDRGPVSRTFLRPCFPWCRRMFMFALIRTV